MSTPMNNLGIVKRNITRADKGAVEQLGLYGVATVHEAMGRLGLMHTVMRPIYKGARVSGTAVTVLLHPGDNYKDHSRLGTVSNLYGRPIQISEAITATLGDPKLSPFVNVDQEKPYENALAQVPQEVALRYLALPLTPAEDELAENGPIRPTRSSACPIRTAAPSR